MSKHLIRRSAQVLGMFSMAAVMGSLLYAEGKAKPVRGEPIKAAAPSTRTPCARKARASR